MLVRLALKFLKEPESMPGSPGNTTEASPSLCTGNVSRHVEVRHRKNPYVEPDSALPATAGLRILVVALIAAQMNELTGGHRTLDSGRR